MPDEQLTNEEWLELYRYLVDRLEERGFAAVRAELEAATAEPVFEESTAEEDVRISRIIRGKVGKATIRLRTPPEMFETVLEILRARLIELPAVANAIRRRLERPADQIEFRLDTPTQSEPVPLSSLSVTSTELNAITDVLMRLGLRRDRMKTD